MIALFFRVVCGLMVVDILAKYHPETAKIKYPSAKLLEKITEGITDISSKLHDHFKKLNEEMNDNKSADT